ncbi:unnamed protein product [Sphagnum troendelagicum]
MMQQGGDQADSRNTRLGQQQMKQQQSAAAASPQQQQQQHQNQTVHAAAAAASLSFSLGGNGSNSQGQQVHSQHTQQQLQQQQQQQHSLSLWQQLLTHNTGDHGNELHRGHPHAFHNLEQVPDVVGEGFGQLQQFGRQQQLASHGLPHNGTNLFMGGGGRGLSMQALMNGLAVLHQKVQQLQALVPLMVDSGPVQSNTAGGVTMQQHAATAVMSILSQLAGTATGMLPQHLLIQQNHQPSDLELSQFLAAGDNSNSNHVPQSGGLGCQMGMSLGNSLGNLLGNNMLGNSYLTAGGLGVHGDGGEQGGGGQENCGLGFANGGGAVGSASRGGVELSDQDHLGDHQVSAGVGPSGVILHNQMTTAAHEKPDENRFGFGGGMAVNRMSDVADNLLGVGGGMSTVGPHESRGMSGSMDEHDDGMGADEDDGVSESLPPGSYDLVEIDAMEIMAEHTHFCEICGKGFKRDANLRMHMRGHGDEYKTLAALAKPEKTSQGTSVIQPRRFSCPYAGCKRNKKHSKFLPLKTMLCVKNHYRRSHCPKMLVCSKCKSKKFSVLADLKTHEKHCGRNKWQCSCGTTFSRKDKLFGHIGLFAGHTPAVPLHEMESVNGVDASGGGFGAGNGCADGFILGSEGARTSGSSGRGSGTGSEMGLGSGMGLRIGGGGLQSLESKDDNGLSDDGGGGLFTNNFLQSPRSGNSASDGLH